ncbi:response regulator, partial [Chitinimonas sp.]|uniref:response regulator n=1 Tax=Chitinimonas sp. TaxID=1934313 RepID=UPI0035B2229C
ELPCQPGQVSLAKPPASSAAILHGRVLLAEDSALTVDFLSMLLASWGLQLDTVGDGEAALAACAGLSYDLVLMDMQMPLCDGITATRRLRQAGQQLPIIGLTANVLSEDQRACIEAGMTAVLTKPIDPGRLYAALAGLLSAPSPHKTGILAMDRPRIAQFRSLLAADQVASQAWLASNIDAFGLPEPAWLPRLRELVDNFDFAAALQLVNAGIAQP